MTIEQQKALQEADKSIREAARLIQMQNAEWKRILEFNEWDKKNKSPQPAPLKVTYQQIKRYIDEKIKTTLFSIDLAIKALNQ